MKRFVLLTFLLLILTIPAKAQCDVYESSWIEKGREFFGFRIVKEADAFYVDLWSRGKFEVQQADTPFIVINDKKVEFFVDDNTGEMSFNGRAYIPEFKSKKRRFEGRWKNEELQITHDITITNGGVNWAITKGTDKPIRFWPKQTENGYTFTFGEEQLFFTIEDGMLCDEKGNKFQQIGSY